MLSFSLVEVMQVTSTFVTPQEYAGDEWTEGGWGGGYGWGLRGEPGFGRFGRGGSMMRGMGMGPMRGPPLGYDRDGGLGSGTTVGMGPGMNGTGPPCLVLSDPALVLVQTVTGAGGAWCPATPPRLGGSPSFATCSLGS